MVDVAFFFFLYGTVNCENEFIYGEREWWGGGVMWWLFACAVILRVDEDDLYR